MADAKADTWLFFADCAGKQHWNRVDAQGDTLEESHRAFDDRYECVEDAKRHGYKGRSSGADSP